MLHLSQIKEANAVQTIVHDPLGSVQALSSFLPIFHHNALYLTINSKIAFQFLCLIVNKACIIYFFILYYTAVIKFRTPNVVIRIFFGNLRVQS